MTAIRLLREELARGEVKKAHRELLRLNMTRRRSRGCRLGESDFISQIMLVMDR